MTDRINYTKNYVKKLLKDTESGHDFLHIQRVLNNAMKITQSELVDTNPLIIKLSCLLHDIADPKLNNRDQKIDLNNIKHFLSNLKITQNEEEHIMYIIKNMSFKNHFDKQPIHFTNEFNIVQDADRLDAIGAIGIARAFSYGGYKKHPFYTPDIKPQNYQNRKQYQNTASSTISHFYEKLLLLKELMRTKTGRKMAEERHQFMLTFLNQFDNELDNFIF